MSVLALIENWEGKFKKTSFETLHYAKQISEKLNRKLIAVTFGSTNPEGLKNYGADKIINISNHKFENISNDNIVTIITELIDEYASENIVISNTITGKNVAPLLASHLNYGLISNAMEYPESHNPLIVNCKGFSSKAYIKYESNYTRNIITILPNSIGEIQKIDGNGEIINIEKIAEKLDKRIKIINRSKASEKISLADAEIVISAGRGLKSPENWKMVEELAALLGAGTACSKPVSDMGWRPHSEHVGQTGLAINPNLYIAIGISGAIQHLAGVNGSKNIVVINIDPEAPFFKAANYGIVGDAFVVIPKLITALKNFKN